MAEGFRNRMATNVARLAPANPNASRSGLAEGLDAVGDALGRAAAQDIAVREQVAASEDRIAEDAHRRQRSATIADRAGAWAELQGQAAGEIDALRTAPKVAGAPGHAIKAAELVDARAKAFVATLGDDPDVVERFAPMVAGWAAQTKLGEQRWGIAQDVKAEASGLGKWADVQGNGIVGAVSRDDAVTKLSDAMRGVDTLGGGLDMPDADRVQMIDGVKRDFVKNFLDNRIAAGDQAGAKALLDKGQFDTLLDPDAKVQFYRRIDVADAQAANDAARAVARQQEAARDAVKALKAKVDGGIAPTDAEFRAVQGQATGAKLDQAELIDLGVMQIRSATNARYGGLVDQPGGGERLRAERDALRAKIAGGRGSETDQVMAAQLDTLVGRSNAKETDPLKALLAKGAAGTLQALGQLTGSPQARYEKAEALKPGLGGLASLPPTTREYAVRGEEILKARPKDFGSKEQVAQVARAQIGPVLAGELGSEYRPIVERAWGIMAARRDATGGFDAEVFRQSLILATGATTRPTGQLQGGVQRVRGHSVELPDWATPSEFDTFLSRQDWAKQARYGNGRPADAADVLAHYRPSYVGDDAAGNPRYTMLDVNGDALDGPNRRPLTITVWKRR